MYTPLLLRPHACLDLSGKRSGYLVLLFMNRFSIEIIDLCLRWKASTEIHSQSEEDESFPLYENTLLTSAKERAYDIFCAISH